MPGVSSRILMIVFMKSQAAACSVSVGILVGAKALSSLLVYPPEPKVIFRELRASVDTVPAAVVSPNVMIGVQAVAICTRKLVNRMHVRSYRTIWSMRVRGMLLKFCSTELALDFPHSDPAFPGILRHWTFRQTTEVTDIPAQERCNQCAEIRAHLVYGALGPILEFRGYPGGDLRVPVLAGHGGSLAQVARH
jgi:hypothetical protein